jgi:hypothetical protein
MFDIFSGEGQCDNPKNPAQYSYEHVFSSARDKGVDFWGERGSNSCLASKRIIRCIDLVAWPADLPGYSRSVYAEDHALLTPESRVWAPNTYGW